VGWDWLVLFGFGGEGWKAAGPGGGAWVGIGRDESCVAQWGLDSIWAARRRAARYSEWLGAWALRKWGSVMFLLWLLGCSLLELELCSVDSGSRFLTFSLW
jgi:hypothetical protein